MKKSDFWFAVFLVAIVLGGAVTIIMNENHGGKRPAKAAFVDPYFSVPVDDEGGTLSFACIDGKAFAVTAGRHGVVSAVQVFKAGMAGVPEECPKGKK